MSKSVKEMTMPELIKTASNTFSLLESGKLKQESYNTLRGEMLERAEELGTRPEIEGTLLFQESALNEADTSKAKQQKKTLPSYFYMDERTKKIRVSCPDLAKFIKNTEHLIFENNSSANTANRYWYENGVYKPVSDKYIKGQIQRLIEKYPPALKAKDISEVFEFITNDLSYFVDNDKLNADENIINFQNGILCLDTMQLKSHSPSILSTIQIPCKWTNRNIDTPVFDKYMHDLTEGNKNIEKLLLQFIGVCISNVKGYRMKKALMLVGAGDTGKSQLKLLVERLLGIENYMSIDLKDIEARFGSSYLYGKRLAGASDMSYMSLNELNTFKSLTGGDNIFAEQKGKQGFSYKFYGLLWFCMNELPSFGGDRGEWVYQRMMIVNCNNVIPSEKQDKKLCDNMYKEREGIIFKAVKALQDVINNDYNFAIPDECITAKELYMRSNSPVQRFFDECCIMRDGRIIGYNDVTTTKMKKVFNEWCKLNNNYCCPSGKTFNKEMARRLNLPEDEISFKNSNIYYVFTLTDEAKETYSYLL